MKNKQTHSQVAYQSNKSQAIQKDGLISKFFNWLRDFLENAE